MNRSALVLCLLVSLVNPGAAVFAEVDSAELSKSVVKVLVKTNGKTSHGTGFVWKDSAHIVTSLHVMRPNGAIYVVYKGERIPATIARTLQSADLVLLKSSRPITGAVPLVEYDSRKPAEDSQLKVLGYNQDAIKFSSRKLIKGYVEPPETLKSLVPSAARKSIEASGMPSLDLGIYYTNMGSLSHGYSGAPVFHKGKFVGIGDGGLENGASPVTWIIPATNLDRLLNEGADSLPGNFSAASQHFSAEVDAPAYEEIRATVTPLYSDSTTEKHLTFVKNKTRNFSELLNPEDKAEILEDVEYLVPIPGATYDAVKFDIYEEQENGMVIALPSGVTLVPDDEVQELNADVGDESDVHMNYWLEEIEGDSVENSLISLADKHFAFKNRERPADEEQQFWMQIEGYMVDYGDGKLTLRAIYQERDTGWIEYVSLAANKRTGLVLFVQTALWIDDYQSIVQNGDLHCRLHNFDLCKSLRRAASALIATQMTTFTNVLQATRTTNSSQ